MRGRQPIRPDAWVGPPAGKSPPMAQLPSQSQFGDYGDWPGRDVLDSGGERLGGVREIYLDRETGRPEWVLVDVDGDEARFVPLADASVESSTIRVAHSAATIRSAPGHRLRAADRPVRGAPALRPLRPRLLRPTSRRAACRPTSRRRSSRRSCEPEPSSWSDVAKDDETASPLPAGRAADAGGTRGGGDPRAAGRDRARRGAGARGAGGARAGPATRGRADLPVGDQRAARGLHAARDARRAPAVEPPPPPPPPAPEPPSPPRAAQAPPPPEPDTSGPLAVVKNRKAGVAVGVSIAAVLFLHSATPLSNCYSPAR